MSENEQFEASKFKPGQSGNPAGKVKGTVGGRMKALGALDRMMGKEENIALLETALEDTFRKKPVWFFVNIVMPLLPKETKGVLEGGDHVIEWRSLVSTAAAAAVETRV
jgi:hypothetical protein